MRKDRGISLVSLGRRLPLLMHESSLSFISQRNPAAATRNGRKGNERRGIADCCGTVSVGLHNVML